MMIVPSGNCAYCLGPGGQYLIFLQFFVLDFTGFTQFYQICHKTFSNFNSWYRYGQECVISTGTGTVKKLILSHSGTVYQYEVQ